MISSITQRSYKGSVMLPELIVRSKRRAVDLVVVSFDPEIYTLEWITGEAYLTVHDAKNTPLLTRSLGAMKRLLEPVQCGQAFLRHVSAFDEMIGVASAGSGIGPEIAIAL